MNTILSLLRSIGVLLSLFLLFIFIMPMTVRVINVGNIAGVIFAVWLFCVSCRPVQSFFSRIMHQNGFLTFLYRAVNIGFTAFAVYGIIITCFMALACNSKPADNSTLIVLGAQVRPEGVPSLILRGRIDAAEKYLDEHREAKAVLAGGMGFDEPMSEAKCMYDTMVEDGISPDRLIMELSYAQGYADRQAAGLQGQGRRGLRGNKARIPPDVRGERMVRAAVPAYKIR